MQKSFIFLMIIGITFCFISCTTSHSHIKRILFLTGDDYPGHKWRETAPVLANAIRSHPDLEIEIVKNPGYLASANLTDYDGIILHFMNWQKHAPGEKAREQLQKFVAKGGGLVIVHFACGHRLFMAINNALEAWIMFFQKFICSLIITGSKKSTSTTVRSLQIKGG